MSRLHRKVIYGDKDVLTFEFPWDSTAPQPPSSYKSPEIPLCGSVYLLPLEQQWELVSKYEEKHGTHQ